MDFNRVETPTGDLIIQLVGNMDATGCAEIRSKLEELIATESGRSHVALDLGEVSFLDSSGVGVIVFLYKRMKANGCTLEIINAEGQPLEFIELLRIETAIAVNIDTVHELSLEVSE